MYIRRDIEGMHSTVGVIEVCAFFSLSVGNFVIPYTDNVLCAYRLHFEAPKCTTPPTTTSIFQTLKQRNIEIANKSFM